MEVRRGGRKFCPGCKSITETRVLPEGYSQVLYHGVPVKRRKIVCGRNRQGLGGCGYIWFTYEIPDIVLGDAINSTRSRPYRKRTRKS